MTPINIAAIQMNAIVGDIRGNTDTIISLTLEARNTHHADVIVFPELAVCGYSPEDLLFRPEFQRMCESNLHRIARESPEDAFVIVGHPYWENGRLYNQATVFHGGSVYATYQKQSLPNHDVFDEERYFVRGDDSCVIDVKGYRIGILICEDLWSQEKEGPVERAVQAGAKAIVSLNASPFEKNKHERRINLLSTKARRLSIPILYTNLVGAQDEIVFDGGSMMVDHMGNIATSSPRFETDLLLSKLELKLDEDARDKHYYQVNHAKKQAKTLSFSCSVYEALKLGLEEYVTKNGFQSVILGLSGGIDSALTLCIAVDALGPERVNVLMMPSRFNSAMSLEDATTQARTLKVQHDIVPIDPLFEAFTTSLSTQFQGLEDDITEQNLQARIRGVLLMAMSNKKGHLVVTTGNKSELAVGYSTLYGDMAGGFCALKDVLKTDVYQLAKYRNQISAVIPERVIERAPSAELSHDQTDQDTLPPYEILDAILRRYVEMDQDPKTIVAEGYSQDTVSSVVRLVTLNEHKRQQAPIGIRVSNRAFGKDRRYPVSNDYLKNLYS